MKNILLLLLILFSCSEPKYKPIGQEIIDGKVSAIKKGIRGGEYTPSVFPSIWVQNSTKTKQVDIPFEYENKWHVGDSCLLIIEKYEVIKE